MALYLHDQCMGRSESFSIACSPTRLSRELGISRAMVYRALDHFCQLGYIRRDGAQLHILDAQGLLTGGSRKRNDCEKGEALYMVKQKGEENHEKK